ncbi:hypothetical protein Kpol_1068p8 [Vanderwaltozyma polyspora DSM 70294]|uniref:phosphopentomutase n=1 Tax=Vanderwaltozyma polyspora (strain ATCC 22028 / DSM 70294 / BCRC 21397 / CBS 2163 / NBRC 10782 / NRRL Y-8283 / UCD 57-17) TaxID=436907 RepID=A7TSR3_VANPO|nr:uncharacterized protein Kpol_1068p8 [Vanderwaltozyma polyspora DSM 70294]EDO14698.1 hypothetical protein Kpol_1068p8 [Vanderwaltozyma polyspora DSM 70294]
MVSSNSEFDSVLETLPVDLRDKVGTWLAQDKNPETINEVIRLCKANSLNELHKRFDNRILFGTAGLRSKMEAGFSRMNTLVVLQATQGLATYIKQQFPSNLKAVIGHDHRYHSKEFAEIATSVFLSAGFTVYNLNPPGTFVHTPLVPFTVDQIGASVGVMITASHNPKMDNGYKVYYSNGCQIIPPVDASIAKCIDENLEPWSNSWDSSKAIEAGLSNKKLIYLRNEMLLAYSDKVDNNIIDKKTIREFDEHRKPWFVYTPMHGVGYEIFTSLVLEKVNLKENRDYLTVKEQIVPDPAFPTISFPNPEEKGALDMAIALAKENDISLVIANDPDADRFSAAIYNSHSGEWQQLTGNEIGFLFGYYLFNKYTNMDPEFKKNHPLAMLNSTVSSRMLKSMADTENFKFIDTLTGFKWIGNKAIDLKKEGYHVVFGYEEAIGYMFPAMEHDKDGITASVVFLQAYFEWDNLSKVTVIDILEQGIEKYGAFKEYNGYYVVSNPQVTNDIFHYIRNEYPKNGNQYPKMIGTLLEVCSFRDLTTGFQSDTVDNIPSLPVDPSSQMITITAKICDDEYQKSDSIVRFTMRGSGTEPKLKLYIEGHSKDPIAASKIAKLTWDVLKKEWIRPEVTGVTTSY